MRISRRTTLRALLVFAVIAAGAAVGYFGRPDPHQTKERREWSKRSVMEISKSLSQREGRPPSDFGGTAWLTPDTIFCADGSWLAYRSRCHKEDPPIHDIFVARASDGRWYYSDFHFCIGAVVLEMRGQPESLAAFKAGYHLAEFGGRGDGALAPTWGK